MVGLCLARSPRGPEMIMSLVEGDIVRLRSPRHKVNLENPWYCDHWERLTPFVYLGRDSLARGFARIMEGDGGVHRVWLDDLTTRMWRM